MKKESKLSFIERILSGSHDAKVDCILMDEHFAPNSHGYITLKHDGIHYSAHRFVCLATHGIPMGEQTQAAHSCGNKGCINPKHLRWATASENAADRHLHGTDFMGERNSQAKLTEAEVRHIRFLWDSCMGITQTRIGELYGIRQSVVSRIVNKKLWSHI